MKRKNWKFGRAYQIDAPLVAGAYITVAGNLEDIIEFAKVLCKEEKKKQKGAGEK